MRMAWSRLRHRFSLRRATEPHLDEGLHPPEQVIVGYPRIPANTLSSYPVDILVVERSHMQRPPTLDFQDHVRAEVEFTPRNLRPKLVIESWVGGASTWAHGPCSKLQVTLWEKLGYTTRSRFINSTEVGGAINQRRTLVVRYPRNSIANWKWPASDPPTTRPRPMSNLLTPAGLIPRRNYIKTGHRCLAGRKVLTVEDPMPDICGSFLSTEQGIRRLAADELGRGLGLPKESAAKATPKVVDRTTCVFVWEYLSQLLYSGHSPTPTPTPTSGPTGEYVAPTRNKKEEDGNNTDFYWQLPDLSVGSRFYRERVESLRKAAATCDDPQQVFEEGLRILDTHRNNYDSEGPNLREVQDRKSTV